MITVVGTKGACKIYLDTEGINEMIGYLNYLKNKSEISYDLVVGNELDPLEKDNIIPEGFEEVTYLELFNFDGTI